MSIQIIKLDFVGDPVGFCCPECGYDVFARETGGSLCPHIVFAGEDASGQYQWNNDTYQKVTVAKIEEEYRSFYKDDEDVDLEDALWDEGIDGVFNKAVEAIDSPSAFAMKITTNGIACGPSCTTVYAIVDYAPLDK